MNTPDYISPARQRRIDFITARENSPDASLFENIARMAASYGMGWQRVSEMVNIVRGAGTTWTVGSAGDGQNMIKGEMLKDFQNWFMEAMKSKVSQRAERDIVDAAFVAAGCPTGRINPDPINRPFDITATDARIRQNTIDILRAENESLRRQVGRLQSEKDDLSKFRENETCRANSNYESGVHNLNELDKQRAEVERLNHVGNTLREKLAKLGTHADTLERERDNMRNNFEVTKLSSVSEHNRLREEIFRLRDELSASQKCVKLSNEAIRRNSDEIELLNRRIKELIKQNDAQVAEITALECDLNFQKSRAEANHQAYIGATVKTDSVRARNETLAKHCVTLRDALVKVRRVVERNPGVDYNAAVAISMHVDHAMSAT